MGISDNAAAIVQGFFQGLFTRRTLVRTGLPGGMETSPNNHLGFTYRKRKGGLIEVVHRGRLASTLGGADARDFLDQVQSLDPADAQQLMARLTGNYKHGNEHLAHQHPRNRGRS